MKTPGTNGTSPDTDPRNPGPGGGTEPQARPTQGNGRHYLRILAGLAVLALLADSPRASQFGQEALQKIKSRFSIERMVDDYDRLDRALLDEKITSNNRSWECGAGDKTIRDHQKAGVPAMGKFEPCAE